MSLAADERGGTTPFNLLPMATGAQPGGAEHHPVTDALSLAAWWCRYILPKGGVFSIPLRVAARCWWLGWTSGASKVTGIEKEAEDLDTARRRIL